MSDKSVSIHGAITPLGSTLLQTVVVETFIRILVLDSRSGHPVKGSIASEVLLAEGEEPFDARKHVLLTPQPHAQWDVRARQPIAAITSKRQLSEALKAVGNHRGKEALDKYKKKWKKDKKNAKESTTEVTDAVWYERVRTEYNSKYHRALHNQLEKKGYVGEKDEVSDLTRGATAAGFKRWQRESLGIEPGQTLTPELAKKLATEEYKTDKDGILKLPVPLQTLRAGFRLRVSFNDFAVVSEFDGMRNASGAGLDKCSIEWAATQDVASGAWGWRMRARDERATDVPVEELPEFRTNWTFTVPPCPNPDGIRASLSKRELLAAQFAPGYRRAGEKDTHEPEFVLLALRCCQPVWDEFPNLPEIKGDPPYFNRDVYLESKDHVRTRMHLVTLCRDLGGTAHFGGRGYGMAEHPKAAATTTWRDAEGHSGLDLHALKGAPVFAMCKGKLQRVDNAENFIKKPKEKKYGGGRVCWLYIDPDYAVRYLHLSEFVAPAGIVKAGQILGLAGRTGNLGDKSELPGHVHLNVGLSVQNQLAAIDRISNLYPDNDLCLPSNKMPLLFPCRTQVTNPDRDPAECRFTKPHIFKECWAAAELCCPHMGDVPPGNPFRIQFQLLKIGLLKFKPKPEPSPSPIDGNLGPLPAAGQNPSESRLAIFALSSQYEVNETFLERLNDKAPIGRHPDPIPVNLNQQHPGLRSAT